MGFSQAQKQIHTCLCFYLAQSHHIHAISPRTHTTLRHVTVKINGLLSSPQSKNKYIGKNCEYQLFLTYFSIPREKMHISCRHNITYSKFKMANDIPRMNKGKFYAHFLYLMIIKTLGANPLLEYCYRLNIASKIFFNFMC